MIYGVKTSRDFVAYERGGLSWKFIYQCVLATACLTLSAVVGTIALYGRPGDAPILEKAPKIASAAVENHATTTLLAPVITSLRLTHNAEPQSAEPQAAEASPAATRQGAPKASSPGAPSFAALIAPLRQASRLVAANVYGGLLDPKLVTGAEPQTFADSHPLGAAFAALPPTEGAPAQDSTQVAALETAPAPEARPDDLAADAAGNAETADVPLPAPRPAELATMTHGMPQGLREREDRQTTVAEATPETPAQQPVDKRSFFDKLFGGQQQPSSPALAYASAEDGSIGGSRSIVGNVSTGEFDRYTAIYDIHAHTVYLPDGRRLEAHSGLGGMMDDPRYVRERMRGATPPALYALQPREQLFHGVQALRLLPIGDGNTFGRTGLLAHTYMLGPNGQSNGCVSFRDYTAFLRAYQSGEVKRLAVVAGLN